MSARGVRPGVLHHKENDPADAQPGKRQRTAAGTGRQPLASAPPPPPEEPMVFAGREDVKSLLNEKMEGKNKMDYKGQVEQMMENIKKAQACMRWLLEREDANRATIERINGQLEATQKQACAIVPDLEDTIEETKSMCEELRKQCASLQEALKIVEAEKMDALRSLRDEKEARMGVESLRNGLLEDLHKAKLDQKHLNDQIKMLQDTNKRLQEYNTRLQEYNSNLQADATKDAKTIAKLQKEMNTMVETMNGLKDHANSVKMQLDIEMSLQNEAAKQKTLSKAAKQKTELLKEIVSLRMECHRVKEDRDTKSSEVHSCLARICEFRKVAEESISQIDLAIIKIHALEEEKRTMVNSAFGEDKSGGHRARLTVEDLRYLFKI